MEFARTEFDRIAAIAEIRPQGNTRRIDLPEAERAGARPDAVTVETAAIESQKVPRHGTLGDKSSPLQFAVASFPGIAENTQAGSGFETPSQVQVGQIGVGAVELNGKLW